MKIYLIRHGQTTGDVENRYGGDYDDSLTELGVKQSEEVAEKLRNKGIKKIYCSTRKRARETAEILCKKINAQLNFVGDLRERNNYGIVTGMIKEEAKKKHPKEVEKLEKNMETS